MRARLILYFQCIALQSDRYQPASHVHFSKWIERSVNYQSDQTSLTIVVSVSLDHEGLYFNLRTIFEARGKVRFMFVHKVFGFAAKSPSSIITFFFCRISQKTGKHRRLWSLATWCSRKSATRSGSWKRASSPSPRTRWPSWPRTRPPTSRRKPPSSSGRWHLSGRPQRLTCDRKSSMLCFALWYFWYVILIWYIK